MNIESCALCRGGARAELASVTPPGRRVGCTNCDNEGPTMPDLIGAIVEWNKAQDAIRAHALENWGELADQSSEVTP